MGERLEGWKAIAAYLKRDVRTVQRWELSEQLPIHRHSHQKQASAFAYASELDQWLKARSVITAGLDEMVLRTNPDLAAAPAVFDKPAAKPRQAVVAAIVIAIAVAATGFAARRLAAPAKHLGSRSPLRSLAVLPLTNLTGDPRQDYFADGLTEQLRSELARNPSLEVISGASTARYKHRTQAASEIARQLGDVDGLLEGSVTRSGDRVRVLVDLVDVRTDTQIWSQAYDSDLQDILTLYNEIARSVAREIGGNGRAKTQSRVNDRRTIKPDAYDKFLQARYFSHGWQAGGCAKAESLLKETIALDPSFAEAYAELAFCNAYPDMLGRTGANVVPVAHEAIARALELDDTLPMAFAVLGSIQFQQDFDWPAATRSFQRGLELSRHDPYTNFLYGQMLCEIGRFEEGLALQREGMRYDPLSLDMKTAHGMILRGVGRPGEAIQELTRLLANDPNWATARFWLSAALADVGRTDEAVSEYLVFLQHALLPARVRVAQSSLRAAFARSGWIGFLQQELDMVAEEQRHPGTSWQPPYNRYVSPYWMSFRYARIGDRDRAIERLGIAYENRDHHVTALDIEPAFHDLRSDPRFQDLRRRVGLARQ